MPYTIDPPAPSSGDMPPSKYTVEPPPSKPTPSFGERVADFGSKALHAGKVTLEETGFMPPLHVETAQEFAAAHPHRPESFLGKVWEAGKEALGETSKMSGLVLGPMALGGRPAAPPGPPPLPSSGISPERAMLAKEARENFGIPVTAPQIGMSNTGKIAESASRSLPFSGARAFEMKQRQAFNRALTKTFGEDAPAITQQVMSDAKKRIGSVLSGIENANEVNISIPTIERLGEIEHNALQSLTDQEYSVVKRQLDNVLNKIGPDGHMPGTTYGALLRRSGPLDQAMANQNSNISRPANQIAEALRNALQESLSGEDLAAYRNARFQYKNMKTIEPLVRKSPTGDISPALLNERVSKQFPNRAFDTSGANPLDRLAKIGQAFLREPSTSTTAERGATFKELAEIGGAVALGDLFGAANAAAGLGGTLAANRALSAYLRSQGLAEKTIAKALAVGIPTSHLPGSLQALRVLPGSIFGQADQSDTMRRAAQPVPPQTQP